MFSVEGSSEEKFLNLRSFPLINSLAPEADKSTITYTAYQSYTYSTKIDISTCLPEAFSYKYCIFEG